MAKGKVTKVIDGDTFKVQGGKAARLSKVRAPELGTKEGAKATGKSSKGVTVKGSGLEISVFGLFLFYCFTNSSIMNT